MDVEYISDTGSRHEWRCVHCEDSYLVTFHYLDGAWSVQRIRDDGEREVLDRSEAEQLLGDFPRERALLLTDSRSVKANSKQQPRVGSSVDSTRDPAPEENVGFGATTRSKEEESATGDSNQPAA